MLYTPALLELSRGALVVHSPRPGYEQHIIERASGSSRQPPLDVLLIGFADEDHTTSTSAEHRERPNWSELLSPAGAQLLAQSRNPLRVEFLPASVIEKGESRYLEMLSRTRLVLAPNGRGRTSPVPWIDTLLLSPASSLPPTESDGSGNYNGALMVSSPPHERFREFSRFSVALPHTASVESAVAELNRWLDKENGALEKVWQRKLTEGRVWAAHTAVVRSYIEDTMEAYWEVVEAPYGEGLVGMKFPHGWRTSCGSGGRWCKKLAKRVVPHWLVDAKEK
jgi:hypothetical protein